MTPMISILFPTIRPDLARVALASVEAACAGVSFEVIVVADFPPSAMGETTPCPHLRWIQRERQGVIDAVNVAVREARGEYLFTLNDQSTLDTGALAALYTAAVYDPHAILTPVHLPPFSFVYYGKPFAPFPFAHRDLFERLGGFLDPVYRAFYADPDLALRADAAGVPVKTVRQSVIRHNNNHKKEEVII